MPACHHVPLLFSHIFIFLPSVQESKINNLTLPPLTVLAARIDYTALKIKIYLINLRLLKQTAMTHTWTHYFLLGTPF